MSHNYIKLTLYQGVHEVRVVNCLIGKGWDGGRSGSLSRVSYGPQPEDKIKSEETLGLFRFQIFRLINPLE